MNIIFVGRSHGQSKTVRLHGWKLSLLAFGIFFVLIVAFAAGYGAKMAVSQLDGTVVLDESVVLSLKEQQDDQAAQVRKIRAESQEHLDALTLRMGDMQARLMRLDALGQRLTEVAKLKNGEFDFAESPAVGGPIEGGVESSFTHPEFEVSLLQVEKRLQDREKQLDIIHGLLDSRNIEKELFIAGRPIGLGGWMSSAFGYRSDPFTGKRAWHAGVDFAGKDNSDIVAVASGVVTFSGERYGYGNLIEINHGGGYTTRYAHCKTLLMPVGSVVEKGQVIAKMGSTGRSTGPHVHYEVLKNGKQVNPEKYIWRASLK